MGGKRRVLIKFIARKLSLSFVLESGQSSLSKTDP
jgi:hypothetical protein